MIKAKDMVPPMASDNYHNVLDDRTLQRHKDATSTVFQTSQLLAKEWSDLAEDYGEDKSVTPEDFFGALSRFLELLEKTRATVATKRQKEQARKAAAVPNQPKVFQANAGLSQVVAEQAKQEDISARAMEAISQDPLMSELLEQMNRKVKDRRTVRAKKRQEIRSASNAVIVDPDKPPVLMPVATVAQVFDPPEKPKGVYKKK